MTVSLRRALRSVRDDLRELESHPPVSSLVDAIYDADDDELVVLALAFEAEFFYEEPSMPMVQLSCALDRMLDDLDDVDSDGVLDAA